MNNQRKVAILIFNNIELLDFCGPFEVFTVAGRMRGQRPFEVYTVAEKLVPILTRHDLSVNPTYTLNTCPKPDILVVPGGFGTRQEMNNTPLLAWIRQQAEQVELLLSVCTGALILAKAGLLHGLNATTHHNALAELAEAAPTAALKSTSRFVDNGRIITSAGISAGIDMSLYVVGRLLGQGIATETAQQMEYDWQPDKYTEKAS